MEERFMREVIAMAVENVRAGRGGPFAALVAKDGNVVARGTNLVTTTHDPTAHAEIVAIRRASRALDAYWLEGCDLYTSCEPCPMCMGAVYWAHLDRVFYGSTRHDAARAGFDDAHIYDELEKPLRDRELPVVNLLRDEAWRAFEAWQAFEARVSY